MPKEMPMDNNYYLDATLKVLNKTLADVYHENGEPRWAIRPDMGCVSVLLNDGRKARVPIADIERWIRDSQAMGSQESYIETPPVETPAESSLIVSSLADANIPHSIESPISIEAPKKKTRLSRKKR